MEKLNFCPVIWQGFSFNKTDFNVNCLYLLLLATTRFHIALPPIALIIGRVLNLRQIVFVLLLSIEQIIFFYIQWRYLTKYLSKLIFIVASIVKHCKIIVLGDKPPKNRIFAILQIVLYCIMLASLSGYCTTTIRVSLFCICMSKPFRLY